MTDEQSLHGQITLIADTISPHRYLNGFVPEPTLMRAIATLATIAEAVESFETSSAKECLSREEASSRRQTLGHQIREAATAFAPEPRFRSAVPASRVDIHVMELRRLARQADDLYQESEALKPVEWLQASTAKQHILDIAGELDSLRSWVVDARRNFYALATNDLSAPGRELHQLRAEVERINGIRESLVIESRRQHQRADDLSAVLQVDQEEITRLSAIEAQMTRLRGFLDTELPNGTRITANQLRFHVLQDDIHLQIDFDLPPYNTHPDLWRKAFGDHGLDRCTDPACLFCTTPQVAGSPEAIASIPRQASREIDVDFPASKKDEILGHLRDRYGNQSVCDIAQLDADAAAAFEERSLWGTNPPLPVADTSDANALTAAILIEHSAVPDHGRYSGQHPCDDSDEGCLCNGKPKVCRTCRTYTGESIEFPCRTAEIVLAES